MLAYEAGVRWQASRVSASVNVFDLEFHDAIERRTLIFPRASSDRTSRAYTVIRQDEMGRAYVAGEARPIVSRVNVSRSRILGYEAEMNLGSPRLAGAGWAIDGARHRAGNDLPRRRMPPGLGGASLRGSRRLRAGGSRGTMIAATKQNRLSDGDIGDARIGASRTPASIAGFFNGTAVDRGLVADGRLVATGETLAQVQARVLGTSTLLPMFTETPGFVVFGVRGGMMFGSHLDLTVIGENLGDKNYRLHGSGVDEPGINLMARLRARF